MADTETRWELGAAAVTLLAGAPEDGKTSAHLAERATRACEQLATHLSRLLGETGVQMLFARSVRLASAQVPWLPGHAEHATTLTALRAAMEQQRPDAITDGFVAILSAFVRLLQRLIGDGLVDRLLHEVWPTVFVHEAKDIP